MKSKDSVLFLSVFILMSALLLQTFPQSLLVLDYHLNTETFAAYCVNKDNREMHCNGHCQLDMKMAEMDHYQHDSQTKEKPIVSIYTVPQVIVIAPAVIPSDQSFTVGYYPDLIEKEFPSNIFHPPRYPFA